MRLVHVSGFDAAGVAWNLGQAIRRHHPLHESLSILAARDGQWHTCAATLKETPDQAKAILDAADVVIFHCGTWDWSLEQPLLACEQNWLKVDTHEVPFLATWAKPEKAVIWLDGSVAVRHNVERWRERYKGYRIVATNADVAALYGATWIPACIDADVDSGKFSKPPVGREVRVLAHPYTDRHLKGHDDMCRAVSMNRERWEIRPAQGLPHKDCIALMADADVVADHMRGYFGVVTLEATALGRPVALNVSEQTVNAMATYGWPVPQNWLHVTNCQHLADRLKALTEAPQTLWQDYAHAANLWWLRFGASELRVERMIEWLSRS